MTDHLQALSSPENVTRYQTDGEFEVNQALSAMLAGCVVGACCGLVAAGIAYEWFSLIFVFPMLIGLGIGKAMCQIIWMTNTRNPWATATAALVASVMAIGTMHFTSYCLLSKDLADAHPEDVQYALSVKQYEDAGEELPIMLQELMPTDEEGKTYLAMLQMESFLDYMDVEAKAGIEIGKPGRAGVNIGYQGTIIYWIIEFFIVAGTAVMLVWSAANRPFCNECDQWYNESQLGEFAFGAKRVATIIESGNIGSLEKEIAGSEVTELNGFTCSGCSSPDRAIVQVNEVGYYNGKKNTKNRGYFVLSDDLMLKLAKICRPDDQELAIAQTLSELHSDAVQTLNAEDQPVADHDKEIEDYMANLLQKQSNHRERNEDAQATS